MNSQVVFIGLGKITYNICQEIESNNIMSKVIWISDNIRGQVESSQICACAIPQDNIVNLATNNLLIQAILNAKIVIFAGDTTDNYSAKLSLKLAELLNKYGIPNIAYLAMATTSRGIKRDLCDNTLISLSNYAICIAPISLEVLKGGETIPNMTLATQLKKIFNIIFTPVCIRVRMKDFLSILKSGGIIFTYSIECNTREELKEQVVIFIDRVYNSCDSHNATIVLNYWACNNIELLDIEEMSQLIFNKFTDIAEDYCGLEILEEGVYGLTLMCISPIN